MELLLQMFAPLTSLPTIQGNLLARSDGGAAVVTRELSGAVRMPESLHGLECSSMWIDSL